MKKALILLIVLCVVGLSVGVYGATEVDIIDADMNALINAMGSIEIDVESLNIQLSAIQSDVETIVDNQDQIQWVAYIMCGLLLAWAFISGIRVTNS